MSFHKPLCVDRNTGLGALLLAGLVLPGGSVLIAWAIYRWVAGLRGRSDSTPMK